MNLGVIESRLLPAVERAVASQASVRPGPPLQSPIVLLNEMSPDERAAFHADYIKQGPAGRPAPSDA